MVVGSQGSTEFGMLARPTVTVHAAALQLKELRAAWRPPRQPKCASSGQMVRPAARPTGLPCRVVFAAGRRQGRSPAFARNESKLD
eukprot:353364-Chlamydomonas_euryale.AAC.5